MEHRTPTEEAQRQAGEALDQTRAQATEAVRTAAATGSRFFDNQKRLAAVEVDGYACALHETARRLHEQSQDRVADYTERAARGLDRFATELRDRDLRDSVDRVTDFARRQPLLFISGAVAAGFAFTRFLKSSAPGHDDSRSFGEKLGEGMEKAKETVREGAHEVKEKAAEGKEKVAETVRREEKHGRKRETRPHTAAEVEVPVILKPHEPDSPAPKP